MAAAQNRQARRRQRRDDKSARSCQQNPLPASTALERIPASAPMPGYARFIGRVGALAVALGVGAAVATGYGVPVAHAEDTTQSSNDNKGDGESGQDNDDNENDDQGDDDDDGDSLDAGGGDETVGDDEEGDDSQAELSDGDLETNAGIGNDEQQGQNGGNHLLQGDPIGETPPPAEPPVDLTPPVDATPPAPLADPPPAAPAPEVPKPPAEPIQPAVGDGNPAAEQKELESGGGAPLDADTGPSGVEQLLDGATPVEFTVEELDGGANRLTTFNVEDSQSFSALIAPEPNIIEPEHPDLWAGIATIPGVAARLAYTVAAAFLSPFVVGGPTAPVQPPVLWAVLAWVRREFQRTLFNETPTAMNDPAVTTSEDVAVTISPLANDFDTDEDPLTVTDYTQPEHGTVTYNAVTKQFTYTPDENFHGTDTFEYAVSDHAGAPHWHGILGGLYNVGHQDTATVTVTVAAVDDAATMGPDAAPVDEDTTKVLDPVVLLQNDTDPDGPLTFTGVGNASDGATVTYDNGAINYKPAPNFNGTATFDYYATDPDGNINTGTVTMTVNQVDDGATMGPDAAPVDEDSTKVLDPTVLLQNDTDPDGPLTFTGVGNASDGATVTYENGAINYTPADGFTGDATFEYYATDPDGNINTGIVTMTVVPTDAAPTVFTEEAVVAVGDGPFGVALSPDGQRAYVADRFGGTVSVVDIDPDSPTYNQVIATITVPGEKLAVAVNDTHAFVTNTGGSTITVIDADPNSQTYNQVIGSPITVGARPSEMAFSADGTRLYVTNQSSDNVSVVDVDPNSASFGQVIATIPVGDAPRYVAVTPDGTRAYVTNAFSNNVVVIDVDPSSPTYHQAIGNPIAVNGPSYGVAINPDGTRAYVTNYQAGTVTVIDTNPDSPTYNQIVGDPIQVGAQPLGIAVSPDGTRAYTANQAASSISVIDIDPTSPTFNQVIATVPGLPVATGLVVNADGSRIYVANQGNDSLSVISATNPTTA
ncbi:Ig-like domain-containing protein [Mycolicibacterium arseniciresistens]|uniref:Ig-like domain-containing protein n=1 Tax=Mycolicibacterium arseniciresistens TaxID=3062257 RepID=A0ABT8UNC0_9MYCO|nr:Ig-like domain-containing protein [Mycolicibacterium arseniciresistens]MDO3638290.1 Ig-like domain-containing protein [Mycolicibacterium arseniciresistens]